MPEIIFTDNQLSGIIVNPFTNRKIKLKNVVSKFGTIFKRYRNVFQVENNTVVARPVLALNVDDNTLLKIDMDIPLLPQPFSDIKKSKLKFNTVIRNYKILPEIPEDQKVKITIGLKFWFIPELGYEPEKREPKPITLTVSPRELSNNEYLVELIGSLGFTTEFGITDIEFTILATENNKDLELIDMKLREETPLKLKNIFNEMVDSNYKHCIHDYIKECYPKHTRTEAQMQNIRKINTVNDIYNFAVKYNFKMVAFDQSGNVIKTNYTKKRNKNKTMVFIAANNHLYPLHNKTLHKTKPEITRIEIVEDVTQHLVDYVISGYAPKFVKMNTDIIDYYTIMEDKTEIIYTSNTEYTRCKEILEMFGLGDKIFPTTKLSHIGTIIEQLYWFKPQENGTQLKINTQSFMPICRDVSKSGYSYLNDNYSIEHNEDEYTTDKNKSYAYELMELPYLPVIDIKTDVPKHIFTQDHKINPKYMYVVSVPISTFLLPKNGRYLGSILLFAREFDVKFTLLEEMPTRTEPNYFKRMVTDLYNKLPEDEFKQIMVRFIGKFETKREIYDGLRYIKTMNTDEKRTFSGMKHRLKTTEYYLGLETTESYNILSRNPIADLVKDRSRITVFKMMCRLNLKNADIKQIQTDAITFKSKHKLLNNFINKELSGWKKIIPNEINETNIVNCDPPSFFYKKDGNDTLITGYAGCGKTYEIINNIIPLFNESYIVLTPSHKSLEEYRLTNHKCDVIQKYTMNNMIPEEDIIVVDEIGMVGGVGWNMLYKCKLAGKKLICYGDFNQLAPVSSGEKIIYNNPNFLNMMFRYQKKNNNNFRNKFTHEYYDSLRYNAKNLREQEVQKYNTPYKDADIIIAYLNETRQKYNELMCEYHNIEKIWDIGAKVICKTNNLSQYELYNNFKLSVKEINGDMITLISCRDVEYTLPLNMFKRKNYFNFGYAITLHGSQSDTINSFHFCEEDIKCLDGRALYTLISRLKQK